jgi:hypothetical protein
MQRILMTLAALLSCTMALPAMDAVGSLKSWISIDDVELDELAKGKIYTESNASMNLDRGMSCQAVFIVNAPVETTLQTLLKFNATRYSELSVFQHQVFQGEKDSGFDKLQLDPKIPASAALIRAMGDSSVIQLSTREVAQMPKDQTAEAAVEFLSGVIKERWTRFAQHGEFGSVATFDAGSEIRSLLSEESKVATHFDSLLAPVKSKGAPGTPKHFYWDLSSVNKKSAVQLGVVYTAETTERRQVLDVTYYSSGGYLVNLTLYEMLPITLDGREQTLVWQGSLVTATGLAGGLGLKRKIGSGMMLSDVERWIGIFRKEAEKAAR